MSDQRDRIIKEIFVTCHESFRKTMGKQEIELNLPEQILAIPGVFIVEPPEHMTWQEFCNKGTDWLGGFHQGYMKCSQDDDCHQIGIWHDRVKELEPAIMEFLTKALGVNQKGADQLAYAICVEVGRCGYVKAE